VSAQYLVRFDDICPTMDWSMWGRLEPILVRHGIKPILAVVPDNLDPKLVVGDVRNDFWQCVRDWQAAGWFIALHGYQHTYVTQESGILGINTYSEFAGMSYEAQREKLTKALGIFSSHNVRVDGWVAPAHSFDSVTVKILLELGVDIVSDGFFVKPIKHLGATWIPQQIWQFRKMPFGLWTVCYHHNKFTDQELVKFEQDIEMFTTSITSVDRVLRDCTLKQHSAMDLVLSKVWLAALRLKRSLR
jgi:peptidoglycan/xylan/chitin deacetylase (PgdA/CDA1 family)